MGEIQTRLSQPQIAMIYAFLNENLEVIADIDGIVYVKYVNGWRDDEQVAEHFGVRVNQVARMRSKHFGHIRMPAPPISESEKPSTQEPLLDRLVALEREVDARLWGKVKELEREIVSLKKAVFEKQTTLTFDHDFFKDQ